MKLLNKATGTILLTNVKRCDSFLCKLRGLQFQARLAPGEGLLLQEPGESRLGASIHMFFMRFSIATIWLDARMRVVDTCLAHPWRPYYAPRAPAQYTLETSPALLDKISVGDELVLED
jgi:uncharacterized membrane protein (UPF0127 family)